MINFPLFCPKCKQETLINMKHGNIIIREPDAKTQSRNGLMSREEIHGLRNRVFIISFILIWLRKSSMELMCRELRYTCFAQQRWAENMKRDIVLILKIRIFGDIICSMKNCFAVIVQSGWKK